MSHEPSEQWCQEESNLQQIENSPFNSSTNSGEVSQSVPTSANDSNEESISIPKNVVHEAKWINAHTIDQIIKNQKEGIRTRRVLRMNV